MLSPRLTSLCMIAVLVLVQGCGTVFNGKKQKVFIESSPSQATFRIPNTEIEGTTPATVELKRKRSYTVVVEKDGYKPQGAAIEKNVAWIPFLFDIICWPTFFVDFATGGAYELRPSQLYFELEKQ